MYFLSCLKALGWRRGSNVCFSSHFENTKESNEVLGIQGAEEIK
jgi:hypothetical protein